MIKDTDPPFYYECLHWCDKELDKPENIFRDISDKDTDFFYTCSEPLDVRWPDLMREKWLNGIGKEVFRDENKTNQY